MPRPRKSIFDFPGPFRGLDTDRDPSRLGPGWLFDCDNVINLNGRIRHRPGYTQADLHGSGLTSGAYNGAITAHPIRSFGQPDWVLIQEYADAGAYRHAFHAWSPSRKIQGAPGVYDPENKLPEVIGGTTFGSSYATRYRATYADSQPGEVIVATGHTPIVVAIDDGGTPSQRPMGLAAPTACTYAAGGAGNLTGAFAYVATWYNASNGLESAPTPDNQNHVLLSNAVMTVNKPTGTPATGVTHWRIYRRRTGSALTTEGLPGGGTRSVGNGTGASEFFLFVAEVPVATTSYSDNVGDSSIGPKRAPWNNYPPPHLTSSPFTGPNYVAIHKGRAFYCDYRSRDVWYSELVNNFDGVRAYEYVGPESVIELPIGEHEYVTALKSWGDALLVFTDRGVLVMDTDELETLDPIIRRIPNAPGCHGAWTIQELPASLNAAGSLIYANGDGVYLFDGASSANLIHNSEGGGITALWNTATMAPDIDVGGSLYNASSAIDTRRSLYILTVAKRGAFANNLTFVWNFQSRSWTVWKNFEASCWFMAYEKTVGWPALFFGRTDGHVYRLDDEDFKPGAEGTHTAFSCYRSNAGSATDARIQRSGNNLLLQAFISGAWQTESTINLTASATDTMGEVVTAINGVTNWSATLVGSSGEAATNLVLHHPTTAYLSAGAALAPAINTGGYTCEIALPAVGFKSVQRKKIEDFVARLASAPGGSVTGYFDVDGKMPTSTSNLFNISADPGATDWKAHCGVWTDRIAARLRHTRLPTTTFELVGYLYDGETRGLRP